MDINKLIRFRFIAEVNINLQKKKLFFGNLMTITQEGKKTTNCCYVFDIYFFV